MDAVSITDFLKAINGQTTHLEQLPLFIQRITLDSRDVSPGDVYWAIRGKNYDGHQFVKPAIENGASACIVQTPFETEDDSSVSRIIRVDNTLEALAQFAKWYRSRYSPITIGVTGSFGKTTTRELLDSVLSVQQTGIRCESNYNNEIGVPLTILRLKQEHKFLIIEMGAAKAGDILPLAQMTAPQIGIVTGIGPAHLSGFRTIDQIIQTKGDLIACLPKEGLAVIPGASKWTTQLSRRALCRVLTFGPGADCSYRATRIQALNNQLIFEANGHDFRLPMSGRHHQTTALSVIAVATELGYSPQEIQQGFEKFQSVEGRGNVRQTSPWTVIDDTYNANPVSCHAACEMLASWHTTGRRILVLGDMLELGPKSATYHQTLGHFAAEKQIDIILALGEHAREIVAGAKNIEKHSKIVRSYTQQQELIEELQTLVQPEDVVLVKGSRGMRMERVVQTLLVEENKEPSKAAA